MAGRRLLALVLEKDLPGLGVRLALQGLNMEALNLGCQGRAGPWFPGVGHRNLVHVSKKNILELVEVLWENEDFQFSGSLGVGKDSCGSGGDFEHRRGDAGPR